MNKVERGKEQWMSKEDRCSEGVESEADSGRRHTADVVRNQGRPSGQAREAETVQTSRREAGRAVLSRAE